MTCDHCARPARHAMTADDGRWDVCCVHADEVMAAARDLVPAAEGAEGWEWWVRDHGEMCRKGDAG